MSGRLRYLVVAGAAIAALVVAFFRRHSYEDSTAALKAVYEKSPANASTLDFSSFNAFDPFHVGNAYLWLGIGAALIVALVLLALVDHGPRPLRWAVPPLMVLAAGAAIAVALDKRHDFASGLPELEGAYFNRFDNGVIGAYGDTPHSVFDPFAWGNAYLWLGVGAGLLLGAAAVAASRRSRPSRAE